MDDRRQFPRVSVRVHARGSLGAGDGYIPFSAYVVNISKGGVQLKLSEDSSKKVRQAAREGAPLKDASVDMRIISYVEDTFRVTGTLVYMKGGTGGVIMGVRFGRLDEAAERIIAAVMARKPSVEDKAEFKEDRPRFTTVKDFVENLTQFTILYEKEGEFYIGRERFVFVGMHKTDGGEVHVDCIESIDHRGKVFCPDCKALIDPADLF